MESDSRRADVSPDEPADVVRLRAGPDRHVFIENGNPDGWIATDAVVDLDR